MAKRPGNEKNAGFGSAENSPTHHYPVVPGLDPLAHRFREAFAQPETAFTVAVEWGLTDLECARALGFPDPVADYWRDGLPVPFGGCNMARAAYLISIHQSAAIVSQPADFAEWCRSPMTLGRFAGRTVVEMVTSGDVRDMEHVCRLFISLCF
jgi:hypothetical protein